MGVRLSHRLDGRNITLDEIVSENVLLRRENKALRDAYDALVIRVQRMEQEQGKQWLSH